MKDNSQKKVYLDKREFYAEIVKSHNIGELTPRAVEMFDCLISNVMKMQFYANPMDYEDCRGHAWLRILQYWDRFDYENRDDPFGYFTSVVTSATAQQWNTLRGIKASYKGETFVTMPLSVFGED